MTPMKSIAGVLGAVLLLLAFAVQAATPFDAKMFQSAQESGKTILVDVTASWCPVCAKQQPIIQSLEKDPKFAGVAVMKVDFDTQKDALKSFKVTSQSTLIVFKGKTEIARSTGETDAARIRLQLEKGL
ncbi:MAG: thioredoxin family protein [Rhodospirillales bacterium]|nr:thioredoxin family protein [Rhodospirillales bacterium]